MIVTMANCYFLVADNAFLVQGEDSIIEALSNYNPFIFKGNGSRDIVFFMTIEIGKKRQYKQVSRREDGGFELICGQISALNPVYEYRWQGQTIGQLICSQNHQEGKLILSGYMMKFAIDNALMLQYALRTVNLQTVVFHASAISYDNYAYMFLGASGTGKSTHSRLWLQSIENTELINDDHPVVRIIDGGAYVYGSPWSGKTPCYKQIRMPLGSIVRLHQAPQNKIWRCSNLEAYFLLAQSITGKRMDRKHADGLHETESFLTEKYGLWFLDCLPNEDAAILCRDNIALK